MVHFQCRRFLITIARALVVGPAIAQNDMPMWASNLIVPQRRVFDLDCRGQVQITAVTAQVRILEQVATTTMEINLHNPTRHRLDAELLVSVPEGAVVRGFATPNFHLPSSIRAQLLFRFTSPFR